ncbi:CheR family methyltransferase [Thermodesulfobacteriota bacterium]
MQVSEKISIDEFRLIRDYIEKNCGIHLTDDKTYLIHSRLTTLMVENGCGSFTELYQKSRADETHALRDKIVEAITTNETFWFRDSSPFHILDEELLRQYVREIASGKRWKVRIWCSACSTGQEPYSIAMTVLEFARKQNRLKPEHFEIVGTDISTTVLYLAMAGRYDNFAMSRGLPEDLKNRYFTQDGNVWAISSEVQKMVTFKKLNLQEAFSSFGKQDIIFCRNVLFYFSDEFKKDILRRIAEILRPGGYLFLGASESIFNYTREYEMLRHTMGLYYKVREEKGH